MIGEKLSHSFSKDIHNKLYDYDYELIELSHCDLPDFLERRNFKGINVTIPYKTEVMNYLDRIDDAAREIGAVNTVVNRAGKLFGYNTDAFGLTSLIEKNNIDLLGKKVLILGSGGTSKTASFAANKLKASSVLRVSRTQKEGFITYSTAESMYTDADIIINTTPCGMFPNANETPIDLSKFKNLKAVIDVIYNPLKTRLLLEAEKLGVVAVGGLYMLIMQAVGAAELFISKKLDADIVNNLYRAIKRNKQNIVLTGMPASGKTTVGKRISDILSMSFFDSDEVITKKAGKTPADIIRDTGEANFRKIERDIISDISSNNHAVIATGGGVPTIYDNILSLKSNGKIYFIDRPLEFLDITDDRPLSASNKALRALYEQRIDTYRETADVIIKNDGDIEYVINKIKEDFCNENIGN